MIVTIDGPAGAGKSHVARALAKRLGFDFLDTGATYRAVTLAAINGHADWEDEANLIRIAQSVMIDLDDDSVFLDGQDVTRRIRGSDVTNRVHHVADVVEIRELLADLQREIASQGKYVTEGRDQGTVVFPDAECKIYLTATPEERARRRLQELRSSGEAVSFENLLQQQNERDRRDESRPVGRLQRASDAIEVCSDGLTVQQVVDRLEELVRSSVDARQSAANSTRQPS